MRTYRSLRCMLLTAHSLCSHHTAPHSIRLAQSSLVPSELEVGKRWGSTVTTSNHEMPGQATAGQLQAVSLICSRDLPVCQHRSVLCPLGVPTHAINRTVLRCFPQSELVSQRLRTNAKFSLPQTSDDSPSVPAF